MKRNNIIPLCSEKERRDASSGQHAVPNGLVSLNTAARPRALGKHVTIECYNCDSQVLNDSARLEQVCIETVRQSGATILSSHFHYYTPQGISGVIIISESHFTIHTWPEHKYAACDFFSCSDTIDIQKALDSLKRHLKTPEIGISADMARGIVDNNRIERYITETDNTDQGFVYSWKKKFELSKAWGILTSVDIADCDPKKIRDGAFITAYVHQLCDHIGMRRFGDTVVVNFGEDERVAGFSMTQLIESSLVSGHFANQTNRAYIDIFSCKFYEPRDAAEFSLKMFSGSNYVMQVALRS
ncbi:MAG: adenosylmethionine decarboxylase [Deltaproteobacteria bacterium]|nr:adenosylmethionine decarboxylase [Deltaproteobacteria bacterium]